MVLQKINKKRLLVVAAVFFTVLAVVLFIILQVSAETFSVTAVVDDGRENQVSGSSSFLDNQTTSSWGCSPATKTSAATDHHGGIRFRNVAVAQGSSIGSAKLRFHVTSSLLPAMRIYGNDVDNAALWSSGDWPSQMTWTTASQTWTIPNAGGVYVEVTVTDIVQEIVNRSGWSTGNSMKFGVIMDNGATLGCGTATAGNVNMLDNSSSVAPQLVIETEEASTVLKIKAEALKIKAGILKIK